MSNLGPDASFKDKTFTITRVFDAPRDTVWAAFTRAEHAKQWFGPKGCTITYCKVDLRPGGMSHYCMEYEGSKMWGKWTYREIEAPKRLVAIVAFTDKGGEAILEHPGMPGWPRQILSTVTFEDLGDKTRITVEWTVYEGTDEEQRVFKDGAPDMKQGWTGSFDQLDDYLAGKHMEGDQG